MAANAMKTPLVRHFVARSYAQACPAPSRLSEFKIVSAALPSNTVVSSVDNGSPCTRVAVSFKAGSRYEPASEPGLTHVLRSATGFTTKNIQEFIVRRHLAQLGATLTATMDREFVTYTLEVPKTNIRDALKIMNAVISNQEFRPWELSDNVSRLKHDIAIVPPQVRAVDLLHKAAYRRNLGNSLFISPRRIGNISSESLQHFTNSYMTPSRCSVAIVGDNQERAIAIANALQLGSGKAEETQSRYSGGELRKEMGGELAHIAIAVEGAKAGTNEALALAVAAKALGNGPSVKWGADNSLLAKAIGNIGPFAAAGFNLSYTDSGLFGVILTVPKDESASALKSAVSALKQGLSADAVKRGKNQLRVEVLNEQETATTLAESISTQGLYGVKKTPRELADDIDKMSESDVSRIVSGFTKGKMSLGAAGNLSALPYLDEI